MHVLPSWCSCWLLVVTSRLSCAGNVLLTREGRAKLADAGQVGRARRQLRIWPASAATPDGHGCPACRRLLHSWGTPRGRSPYAARSPGVPHRLTPACLPAADRAACPPIGQPGSKVGCTAGACCSQVGWAARVPHLPCLRRMAPEHLMGGKVSPKADVYSFGVRLLAAHVPLSHLQGCLECLAPQTDWEPACRSCCGRSSHRRAPAVCQWAGLCPPRSAADAAGTQERPMRGKLRPIECPAECPEAARSLAGEAQPRPHQTYTTNHYFAAGVAPRS